MSAREFETTLEGDAGKVRLYLPFSPHDAWGKKTRHHVEGTLNGVAFAGSIGARDGRFFIPIAKPLRAAAKVDAGDRVRVSLRVADAARPELPSELAAALDAHPAAAAAFTALTPFQQNDWAGWIATAKQATTRSTRAAKAVDDLARGVKQRGK